MLSCSEVVSLRARKNKNKPYENGGWEEFKAVKRRMKYKWEDKKDDDNDDDIDLSFLYT